MRSIRTGVAIKLGDTAMSFNSTVTTEDGAASDMDARYFGWKLHDILADVHQEAGAAAVEFTPWRVLAAAFSQCRIKGVVHNTILCQELDQAIALMQQILMHDDGAQIVTNQLIGGSDGQ
jgi:hypothetical protein